MAYINVAEWSPDQVTDWLKGLDDSMYNYVYAFAKNEVNGYQLLHIRPYELEELGMCSIGHQEIVLEAVENLRNFHYNLDKENLQFMALHLATSARSLHRQLNKQSDAKVLETQILSDITRTIATIKPLIGWLERAPFQGQFQFTDICRNMLRLGLVMATIAQRERFVENPVQQIRVTAETLERLANYIIQDITDPMLLQPASLNLVTLKKRESELGFNIESSYNGIHRITDIKHNSPAHNSGKIEDGDEIVQINYQTVVGWQYKTVLMQLRESLPDVLLTLKKRPKHTKIYGQIYMQPYRLPSKKRSVGNRWGEIVPSPRSTAIITTAKQSDNNFKPSNLNVENEKNDDADTDSVSSDILTPTDTKPNEKESRLYYPKPRAMLQRRNTICGDELLGHKNAAGIPSWHERKSGAAGDPASPSLRDKSISFGFGLELTPRPTTCIGISSSSAAADSNTLKFGSCSKLSSGSILSSLDGSRKLCQVVEQPFEEQEAQSKAGVSKVVRFDANMKTEDYNIDEKYMCNIDNTILETFEPIPFADDENEETIETLRNITDKSESHLVVEAIDDDACNRNSLPLVEAVNAPLLIRRGRLDKSHSTPTYDNSGEESDTPPAIEPRKEFLLVTPPVPPPRPRKLSETIANPVPVPPPKPPGLLASLATAANPLNSKPALLISKSPNTENDNKSVASSNISLTTLGDTISEASELLTPVKSRTLTLKKKHSLIAKRRNVNLKTLGTGEIQGHLYRRTKDKRGVTFWARLYFVMLDTILYGFRSKEASKASCVIFLPGFTVSFAKEVHSKPFAFKVYHTVKTFYFAAESQDALNQWVEFLRQATLNPIGDNCAISSDLFSENESSGEENELMINSNLCTPSPQSRDSTTTNQLTISSKTSGSTPPTTTTSGKSDRSYLGSLRKLTKGSLPFKSSSNNEKKNSSLLPVPTEQFRSYRKVPGGSFGIQIGTNTPGYHDLALHINNTSGKSIEPATGKPATTAASIPTTSSTIKESFLETKEQYPAIQGNTRKCPPPSLIVNNSCPPTTPTATPTAIATAITTATVTTTPLITSAGSVAANQLSLVCNLQSTTAPAIESTEETEISSLQANRIGINSSNSTVLEGGTIVKKIPYNFIHASNPNLVEFDFQTSKTLDYALPKINSTNSWDAHPTNIQGFVTLKDLMLQKQEEEAQEMYNNRVLLGVEKKEEHKRRKQQTAATKATNSTDQIQIINPDDSRVVKTQSRSLPKPPDYEISFKPDDEDIQLTRTKEGLKLRDFGYELISGDEPGETVSATTTPSQTSNHSSASNDNSEHISSSSGNWTTAMKTRLVNKNKKHSNTNSSFKKKGKLETFKTSSERIFQFGKHSNNTNTTTTTTNNNNNNSNNNNNNNNNSSCGITMMTLPLHKKHHHHHNSNESGSTTTTAAAAAGVGIKKSQTYNNDLKDKIAGKYEAHRKNSAPMPIFAKLNFSSNSNSNSNSNSIQQQTNNNKQSNHSNEKKLLGSPLLHRTVFGVRQHTTNPNQNNPSAIICKEREYNQEIFSQVIFPKVTTKKKNFNISATVTPTATSEMNAPIPPPKLFNTNNSGEAVIKLNTPEYPNMECPPVFEPDIYSLTDPNASLLLRRNTNSNNNFTNSRSSALASTDTDDSPK